MIAPSLAEAERRIADAAMRGTDRLSLSGLGLKALPPIPPALAALRGLNLSGNRLREVTPDIAGLEQLEWLDLGNNRLAGLPPEIHRLTQLVSLDLSENRLTSLPPEIGALSRLIELSLYRNQLSEIPESLVRLSNLKRLDAAANRLSTLPTFDGRLARLETLDLSWNALGAMPSGLDRLAALRSLNLAGNRIESLDGIGLPPGLKALDISGNLLAEPPTAVLQLKGLEVLEADGNPFGPLPATLHHLARTELKARAESAVSSLISGGMEEGKTYFEPVSFVFGCVVALGGLASVSWAMDRLYKGFGDVTSVVLEMPSGIKLTLANLSHKRVLEIVREHEAELNAGAARLELGQTAKAHQVERTKAFAVDVLTNVPGASLVPKVDGAVAQQFIIYNGPVYNPVMLGPSAKEEIMGDKITISNVQGSVINLKSKLQRVTQSVEAAPLGPGDKEQLKALVTELESVLAKAPAEKREDAEAVADMVETTMEKVAEPAPNKKALQFSLKGIVDAAKGLTDALPVAVKLAAAVAAIFGLSL